MSAEESVLVQLADAYFAYHDRKVRDTSPWDAVDALSRIPRVGVAVVLVLVQSARSPEQLAYVAAGPLEDIVNRAAAGDLELLDEAIPSTPRLVEALGLVRVEPDTAGEEWLRDAIR